MLAEFHIWDLNGARTESLGNNIPNPDSLSVVALGITAHTRRASCGMARESDAREGTLTLRPPPCKRIPSKSIQIYPIIFCFSSFH